MFRTVVAAVITVVVSPACTTNVVIVEQVVTTSGDQTTGFESTSTGELEDTSTSTGDTSTTDDTSTSTSTTVDDTTSTGEPDSTSSTTDDSTTSTSTTSDSTATGNSTTSTSTIDEPTLGNLGNLCLADDECESNYCGEQTIGGGSRCTVPCAPGAVNDCAAQGAFGLCLAHAGDTLWHCDGVSIDTGDELADDLELEVGVSAQRELGEGDIDLVRVPKDAGPYVAVLKPTGGAVLAHTLYQHDGVVLQSYEAAPGEPLVVTPGLDPVVGLRWLVVRNIGEAGGWSLTSSTGSLAHNSACIHDAECASNTCRATPFHAEQPRCLTSCSRTVVVQGTGSYVDNCSLKGLPGICVETGDDAQLMCAGDFDVTPGLYDHNFKVPIGGDGASGKINDVDDLDVFMVELDAQDTNIYIRLHTNQGLGAVKATWLDGTGTPLKEQVVPGVGSMSGSPPLSGPGVYYLLTSHGGGGLNGFSVHVVDE